MPERTTICFNGKTLVVLAAALPYLKAGLFKDLDSEKTAHFVEWADEHRNEKIKPIWHPVIQDRLLRLRKANQGGGKKNDKN